MNSQSALFLILFSCGSLFAAEPKTELGDLNGAQFRIDVPANWNGSLVLYCHGYSAAAVTFKEQVKLNPVLAVFTDQGFAVAQSGYAKGGWAIQEGAVDTESLRRYFLHKYGLPKQTFITGHSMGGFMTMMLMERDPASYDGALPLCGPLAPTNYFMARGAFDLRIVFDYLFPGALPAPDKTPSTYRDKPTSTQTILALLDAQPDKAAVLRRYSVTHNNRDLASDLTFITYMLLDLQERAGGNPFDNRNTIYEIDTDYNAVNDGVKRYAADPKAAAYLREYYTPTGRLLKPMLAIHTTYDPLVPVRVPNMYAEIVEQAGSEKMFVQQYVKHDGHCAILPAEVGRGFEQLRSWTDKGTRPEGGLNH